MTNESTIASRTLRDEFAMAALTGIIARGWSIRQSCVAAELAYAVADAMLKARLEQSND